MGEMMNATGPMRRLMLPAVMALSLAAAWPAAGQSTRDLEDRVRRLEQQLQGAGRISAQPLPGAGLEEAASLQARVIRLEQMVEQLTGQLEEARYKNGQLTTQLEQLSNDMNYRIAVIEQTMGGGQAASGGQVMPPPMPATAPRATTPRQPAATEAGDPLDPNAPLSRPLTPQPGGPATRPQTAPPYPAPVGGATPPPMTDGSVRASQPGDTTFGALRVDSAGRPLPADPNQPAQAPAAAAAAPPQQAPQAAPRRAPSAGPVAGAQLGAPSADGAVSLPDGTPKQQYDFAFDLLRKQDYAKAETAFREFIKRSPKDPLAGNAQYWLGETYYVRGDYQKAAVEFMNGYQNYPKSNKAPDNLLKLGLAMANIGQTQGACTALGRLTKEYPDAGDQIRRNVTQERQRLKCQ